jgi:hypothetical protein
MNTSATVIASYGPDGLLDLPYQVVGFRANINSMLLESKSNKFTKEQMERISKLKPGNSVILTDIRAKGPDGKVVPLSPIPLTLN